MSITKAARKTTQEPAVKYITVSDVQLDELDIFTAGSVQDCLEEADRILGEGIYPVYKLEFVGKFRPKFCFEEVK